MVKSKRKSQLENARQLKIKKAKHDAALVRATAAAIVQDERDILAVEEAQDVVDVDVSSHFCHTAARCLCFAAIKRLYSASKYSLRLLSSSSATLSSSGVKLIVYHFVGHNVNTVPLS